MFSEPVRSLPGVHGNSLQFDHLLQVQEEGNIRIHVLPVSTGAHIGLDGPITLLSFEEEPSVGYSENPTGNND